MRAIAGAIALGTSRTCAATPRTAPASAATQAISTARVRPRSRNASGPLIGTPDVAHTTMNAITQARATAVRTSATQVAERRTERRVPGMTHGGMSSTHAARGTLASAVQRMRSPPLGARDRIFGIRAWGPDDMDERAQTARVTAEAALPATGAVPATTRRTVRRAALASLGLGALVLAGVALHSAGAADADSTSTVAELDASLGVTTDGARQLDQVPSAVLQRALDRETGDFAV